MQRSRTRQLPIPSVILGKTEEEGRDSVCEGLRGK